MPPEDSQKPPEVTPEQLDALRSQLEAEKAKNAKLQQDNKALQSQSDQRAARIATLKNQYQQTRRTAPPTPQVPPPTAQNLPQEPPADDTVDDLAHIEAALYREIVSDPDLTLDDIEGWQQRVKSPEGVSDFLENVKLRKTVMQLKNAQADTGEEPPSEDDKALDALSVLFGGSSGEAKGEVAQRLAEVEAGFQQLRDVRKSGTGNDELAARAIELAHRDPKKHNPVKPGLDT